MSESSESSMSKRYNFFDSMNSFNSFKFSRSKQNKKSKEGRKRIVELYLERSKKHTTCTHIIININDSIQKISRMNETKKENRRKEGKEL